MPKFFENEQKPMGEISSEQVEKIEDKYGGGWFYLVKYEEFEELTEWWQVHREAYNFERRMVAHAPTKELAMEQLEQLRALQHHSFRSFRWDLSPDEKAKCQDMEFKMKAELKQIGIQEALKKAKQKAEKAKLKKKQAETKKQKERIELLKKVGETDRFTGLEI